MRVRVFKNQQNYEELLSMLEKHKPYKAIARRFQCDPSSVVYWARKQGIAPIRIEVSIIERGIFIDTRHPILQQDTLNVGKKRYADYLAEDKARRSAMRSSIRA